VVVLKVCAILVLAFLSATFSGLDLGLMSLNPGHLEMLIKGATVGDPIAERNAKRAKRILPVRRDGNLLLCTVLLGNVAVNSLMAVLLAEFTSGTVGFVMTTFIVVTFGEIVPQSLCFKHGLVVGATLLPILKVFRILFYPLNKPVSLILDRVFGQEEEHVLDRQQMKSALDYQMKKSPDLLTRNECRLLQGSLELSELRVHDVMVPMERAFCLDVQAVMDSVLIQAVADAGYSRLPVVDYSEDPRWCKHPIVIGLLHVKDLLVVDPDSALPVKTLLPLVGMDFHTVDDDESLLSLLRKFRSGTSQLACVKSLVVSDACDPYWRHSGIVVLQDVLNAIVQEDLQEKEQESEEDSMASHIFSNSASIPAGPSKSRRRRLAKPMTQEEALAIHAFWASVHPESFHGMPQSCILRFLLEECAVIAGPFGEALYQRGVPADFACLVLSGELHVRAGREGLHSTITVWNFVGLEALSTSWVERRHVYVPDFSAYVGKDARILLCNRTSFLRLRGASSKCAMEHCGFAPLGCGGIISSFCQSIFWPVAKQ